MIRENTLSSVITLASKLGTANVTLSAIEGTPLATLISAGTIPMPNIGSVEIPFERRLLEGSLYKNQQGICEHDMVMDEILEVVEKTVNFNLNLTQNTVLPMVKRALENMQEYVSNKQALDPAAISISPLLYHKVWSSHYLTGMIERFSETAVKDVNLSIRVPMPAVENEFGLISTGVSRFDDELMDLVQSLEPGTINDLYRRLFVVDNEDYVSSVLPYLNYLKVSPNTPLLVFLIASKLVDNIPEGVMTTPEVYKEYMVSIMAQAGRALCRQIERREAAAKNKTLIISWSGSQLGDLGAVPVVIEVNGDVYNKWLADGGSPDVLYGAFCIDRQSNYDILLERKDSYIAAWNRQQRLLQGERRLQMDNHMLVGLNKALEKEILEMNEEDLLVDRKKYLSVLNEYLRKLPAGWQKDNAYYSVRKAVCNVIYPHTMAFDILVAIDNACEAHQDLPVREAAYYGAMEVVADWLVELMKTDIQG